MTDDKIVPIKPDLAAEEAYERGTAHQFKAKGFVLGPWTSLSLRNDPKHLLFTLARYKFCARMLEGCSSVIDLGPGDGPGLPLLSRAVEQVYSIDWDSRLTEGNKQRLEDFSNIKHMHYDINKEDIPLANVDAAVNIDVIEHLNPPSEDIFMRRIVKCLSPNGILITGTPNVNASQYSSPQSKVQHINLHSAETLKSLTREYCTNAFSFSQNDEIVHTGYSKMAHYIWVMGVGVKPKYLL